MTIPRTSRRILVLGPPLALLLAGGIVFRSHGNTHSHITSGAPTERQSPLSDQLETVLTYNLGVLFPGANASHRFHIPNSGNQEWRIKALHSSCKCTVATVSKSHIAPGDSTEVDVKFKTPSDVTDAMGQIRVEFDAPDAPEFILRVSALVRRPLTVLPDRIAFEVAEGQAAAQTVRVDNFSNFNWNRILLRSAPAWLRIADVREAVVSTGLQRQSWLVTLEATAEGVGEGGWRGTWAGGDGRVVGRFVLSRYCPSSIVHRPSHPLRPVRPVAAGLPTVPDDATAGLPATAACAPYVTWRSFSRRETILQISTNFRLCALGAEKSLVILRGGVGKVALPVLLFQCCSSSAALPVLLFQCCSSSAALPVLLFQWRAWLIRF